MAKGDFNRKQRARFVDAMASGASVTDSAKIAGYSRKHAHRLKVTLADEIALRRQEMAPGLEAEAHEIVSEVVGVLREILNDKTHKDRLGAGKSLLNLFCPKLRNNAAQALGVDAEAPSAAAPVKPLTSEEVAKRLKLG